MTNRFICPNCHVEEYYFDGTKLKCPACNQFDFESALHDSEGNILYQELIKLKKLFFELAYGEIYTCEVEFNNGLEKTKIIPIVSDSKSNKIFIMFDADYCQQNNPEVVNQLKGKTFTELWQLDVKNEIHIEYDFPIIIGATEKDNSIVSYNGWIFKNFVKVD
jgi:hypothetical protein